MSLYGVVLVVVALPGLAGHPTKGDGSSCSKGSPRREHGVAKPMRLTQTLPTERALAFYQLVHGTDLCTMKGRLATHK